MQIDTGSGSRKRSSAGRRGFKKKPFKTSIRKPLKTAWDGTVYKKIHVVKNLIN